MTPIKTRPHKPTLAASIQRLNGPVKFFSPSYLCIYGGFISTHFLPLLHVMGSKVDTHSNDLESN